MVIKYAIWGKEPMRYYFTLIGMAIIKNANKNRCS
jgi:hypothetical protein